MSSPKQPASRSKHATKSSSAIRPNEPEVVDPTWLISALALSFIAALVCAWLTLCLLFYQGEWQLILHPTHTIDQTPANAGLTFEQVLFDSADTGQPRLTGWWIPAQPSTPANTTSAAQLSFVQPPKYAAYTILYLHDGSGSLSATVPALARLHNAGINIFAIDYRGFGQSDASVHPTEARMAEDTAATLTYLISSRHIAPQQIIPYGVGLGASLAANLALQHHEFPAVILDNPDPNPTATALAAHPSRFVPVNHLFRERFYIAAPLAALTTPKLLIANAATPATPAVQSLFRGAASPSRSVTLLPNHYEMDYQAALVDFLDEYLPHAALSR